MKKKYQIFVSSTFEDLKEERECVIKAILEMGHIPVGMEMFSAGDEQQWKLIQSQIDDCDYYVVIVAFRYGSMDGDISYTEKEYNYAISKTIPVLGFIIEDGVDWSANKIDKISSKVDKLNEFKEKIKTKIVSNWKDKNDLYGKVSIALMKQYNTNPRVGWVKSSEQFGPEVINEISRLSHENARLRKEINNYEQKISSEEYETFQRALKTLKQNKRNLIFKYQFGTDWEDRTEFTLFEIFNLLAPELMIENSTKYCARYLGLMFKPDTNRKINAEWGTPSNTVRKILADLNVLGIIHPSSKKHSVNDANEYWTLTEEGKKLFKEVRREILEKNIDITPISVIEPPEESNKETIKRKRKAK